jgi:hypothetical protein
MARPKEPPSGTDTSYGAYRWLLAWTVLFTFLWVLTKSTIGYAAVYYALALILLFLFATNAKGISDALAPLQSPAGQDVGSLNQDVAAQAG